MDLTKLLSKYFPTAYERCMIGIVLIILSFPSLIFTFHDEIFPGMYPDLRVVSMVVEGGICAIGMTLFIWGVRDGATVGTVVFRLTHPRFRRRRKW